MEHLTDAQLASTVTGARAALGDAGTRHGPATDEAPRYELFHAASSLCSQKVRAVLTQHGLPYTSHQLNMFAGQTYLPAYVRLRMLGCEQFGGALVSNHNGSTSASEFGCDGAVVPTLVDWEADDVLVDSHRICLHLDDQAPEERKLRPRALRAAIDEDLRVIDNLPNYQMLMGRKVAGDAPAASPKDVRGAFSQRKVAWCTTYLESHGDEPRLAAAYTAKRAKELSAANALFTDEAMEAAYGKAEAALTALEGRLAGRRTTWLHSDSPTLADLFWSVELSRMDNVGAARFWEGGRLPEVERFATETQALPAIQAAVITWPGAMF